MDSLKALKIGERIAHLAVELPKAGRRFEVIAVAWKFIKVTKDLLEQHKEAVENMGNLPNLSHLIEKFGTSELQMPVDFNTAECQVHEMDASLTKMEEYLQEKEKATDIYLRGLMMFGEIGQNALAEAEKQVSAEEKSAAGQV